MQSNVLLEVTLVIQFDEIHNRSVLLIVSSTRPPPTSGFDVLLRP